MEVDKNMAEITATTAAYNVSSSYRVKFERKQFIELVELAKPKAIYRVKRMHFFAYDGFVIYSLECASSDFKQPIIEAIEFSNEPWQES